MKNKVLKRDRRRICSRWWIKQKRFRKTLTQNRRCANIAVSDLESEVDKMKMILLIKSNVILSVC